MKRIIALLFAAVAIVAASPSANAQLFQRYSGAQTTSYNGGTNVIPAVSTNRYVSIDVPRSEKVSLYFQWKWHASPGAGDRTQPSFEIFRGIDTGSYETNAWQTIVLGASTGTTTFSWMTNLDVGPYGYLRGRWINNGTNAIGTNVVFSYGFKN